MRTLLLWVVLVVGLSAQGQDFGSVAVVGNLFHPREIAGIHAMWDASTINAAPGTTITNWPTSVGFYTASNGVTSKAPLMQRTQYGGRNALEFDGVDDWMASQPISLNVKLTYFGVARQYTLDGTPFFFEQGPNVNSDDGFYFNGTALQSWLVRRTVQHYGSSAGHWMQTNLSFACYSYATNGTFWMNGVTQTNSSSSGNPISDSFVSQKIYFSSRAGTSLQSPKKQYAEHIFYTNVVSDLDRRKVNEYLASKYCIPSAYRGL